MKKIETKRLILRRPYMKDLKEFHEFAILNDVGPTAGWLPHQTLGESKQVLREHIKRADLWVIILKDENKLIGTINLEVGDFFHALNGIVELGYALNSNYWKKGYASEAVKAIIKHAFIDLKVKVIIAGHTPNNLASKKIILNSGFIFKERTSNREFENIDIDFVDMYELTKENWRNENEE